jgi:hypothetical protein
MPSRRASSSGSRSPPTTSSTASFSTRHGELRKPNSQARPHAPRPPSAGGWGYATARTAAARYPHIAIASASDLQDGLPSDAVGHRQPGCRRSETSQPPSAARSWPARLRRACAGWADPTDGTDAAGELPARLHPADARPRHLATRRTAHALERQPLREGDHARVVGRTLRPRLRSKAPRQEQHQRQSDRAPANGGEPPHLAKRAAHPLAGTGPRDHPLNLAPAGPRSRVPRRRSGWPRSHLARAKVDRVTGAWPRASTLS